METPDFEEILSLVEEAQSKGKFNLDEFIKGASYPEDSVEVYLDSAHAYELSKLNELLITIFDPEEAAPIEAKAKELAKKIVSSKVIFKMKGLSQQEVEEVEKQITAEKDSEEWWSQYTLRLLAANIVHVEDSEGNIDNTPFDLERMKMLEGRMPSESWKLLTSTMQKLTLASGYFKGLSDAGFLPKS